MKPSKFERWLFDSEPLLPEEQQELQNLLAVSPEMRELTDGWRAAEADLQQAALVGPQPGLASRWQARLAAAQDRGRRRQVGLALGALLVGALGSLGLLLSLLAISPAGAAATWLQAAINVQRGLEAMLQLIYAMADQLPLAAGALLLGTTLAWLSTLWFVSLVRFAFESLPNGERK